MRISLARGALQGQGESESEVDRFPNIGGLTAATRFPPLSFLSSLRAPGEDDGNLHGHADLEGDVAVEENLEASVERTPHRRDLDGGAGAAGVARGEGHAGDD